MSWPTRSLASICDIQIGKTPSRSNPLFWNGSNLWATISDFQQGRCICSTKESITDAAVRTCGCKVVTRGTLLLSFKLSVGKRAFAGTDLFTNEAIAALTPKDSNALSLVYLYWALGDLDYNANADRAAKGTTLNKAKLSALQIPLPPLPVQKRIAAILDAADALRTKRRESIEQLDSLIQSTFLEMFGDPVTNPKGWEQVPLGDHALKVGSGATPKGGNAAYKQEGIALIRSQNVHDGEFRLEGLALIDDVQAAKLASVTVEDNDVLLNITGASVARVCRAPRHVLPARVNQHVCIIRAASTLTPTFVEQYLLAPSMKRLLLGIGEGGATRQAITKAQVMGLNIFSAPIALQQRFASIVESIEQQKTHLKAHLAELDTLFASLQSRAFNGELVA